jgi:hypothetical protein
MNVCVVSDTTTFTITVPREIRFCVVYMILLPVPCSTATELMLPTGTIVHHIMTRKERVISAERINCHYKVH